MFLNNPNFYKFCQHFPIQNISESTNLHHTWFRQNSAHLLITSKTLFQNIFPNNNLKASLQGELTKYLSASSDTKNICLLVTLPPRQDRFQDNTYVFNNWYPQFPPQNNQPDSTSAKNIDSPNFMNIEKLYAHYSDKHQCVKFMDNTIYAPKIPSRIKILISNPQVPNIKPWPKGLNYRYAGFQILDWNSHFQSPLVWTNEKLRFFFSHKDLFTIKNPIDKIYHKIYCLR